MEKYTETPKDIWEFIFGSPWPISWAYGLFFLVAICGLFAASWKVRIQWWVAVLPLMWLVWQFLAAGHSLDSRLSWPTVTHFSACVVCFYLGFFALGPIRTPWPFFVGLLCGFLVMIASGWSQHFGGLEETRKFFYLYQAPKMKEIPAELVKRMTSHRVFATMFYPNALAGALLLLLPGLLGFVGLSQRALTFGARAFVVGAIGIGALGCLFWSGSKGGWLLMLLLGLVALLRIPFARKYKIVLVSGVLVLGLAGFFVRYAVFFQKGATSVSARFDYWRAAVQITSENPVLGTGPGTFRIRYQEIKRPESELARLVHNDYLEQASDSGIPGFLVYVAFIVVALVLGWRAAISSGWAEFWVWLGVLGWALQGFVEFGLYIPPLAWPAFGLLGWLLRRGTGNSSTGGKPVDSLQTA
jgi:hypothetical protein